MSEVQSDRSLSIAAPPQAGPPTRSIMRTMAEKFGMESAAFERTLMDTVMPRNTSKEAVAAFLVVAHEHNLNPFTREIFAFEGQGGGVRPIVSIDGWIRLVNDHPMANGSTTTEIFDTEGRLVAVEACFYRKDRTHPTIVREYLAECQGATMPWKKWPRRMLRHKAFIQGARIAFGFSGIEDEDEYERYVEATVKSSTPAPGVPPAGAKTLRDLVQPARTVEVQAAPRVDAEPPADAEPPIPSEKWYGGIRLAITTPADEWLDEVRGGKGPLASMTLREIAASTDTKVLAERRALLETGQAQQERNGIVAEGLQRLALACYLHDAAQLEADRAAAEVA